MNFDTKTAQEIKKTLPFGALKIIMQRLIDKKKPYSYTTVLAFKNESVIEEAYLYLQELREEKNKKRLAGKQVINSLRNGTY